MKSIKEYYNNIIKYLKSKKGIKLSICLGILGLLLILLSDCNSDYKTQDNTYNQINQEYSVEDYRINLEENLTRLIQNVDGAGDTQVMVTINTAERNVYAQEIKEQSNADGSTDYESKYITITSNNGKSALISTVQSPEVLGVVVLCKGGSKGSVKEDIYKIVSALTGLTSSNIFVGQLV